MLTLAVGLLTRSALVLGLALLLRRYLVKERPEGCHRLLLSALLVLLVWPALPLVLPEVVLPLGGYAAERASVTASESIRSISSATGPGQWTAPILLWMAGALAVLGSFLLGYVRATLAARRAGSPDDELQARAAAMAASCSLKMAPRILIAQGEVMPQTFGFGRSTVLLPAGFARWTGGKQEAVLLHEFAHVRRHDPRWQCVATVATAMWWFQPLCWWAAHAMRVESERASDAAVLRGGVQASTYASALLEIAQGFRSASTWGATLPAAGAGSLEWRLRFILQPSTGKTRPSSWLTAVACVAVFSAGCSAFGVLRISDSSSKGGVSMRRTVFARLIPGLLPVASLSAAAIAGSVLDPSGTAVLDARASLYNPDTKARQETASRADGKFVFDHLTAGQYILRVDKSGYAPTLRAFNLAKDASVDRGITLRDESRPAPASLDTGASAPAAEPGQMRVAGEQMQQKLIHKINPIYPLAAKQAHTQGKVVLQAVIDAEGVPKDIQVISSPDDSLSQSALEAVRQWRYENTLLNGNPVEVVTEILVNYTLID